MKFLFRRHWGEYIIYNFDYEYIRKYTTIGKNSFTVEISCPGGELLSLKNCETIPLNCRTVVLTVHQFYDEPVSEYSVLFA
jgi:hypothetical protein